MLRIRRYRTFFVFSVIFILSLFQFLRSRDWSPPREPALPVEFAAPPETSVDDGKEDPFLSHGFAPESSVAKPKPEGPLDANHSVDHVEKPDLNGYPGTETKAETTPTSVIADDTKPETPNYEIATTPVQAPEEVDDEFGVAGQGRFEVDLPDTGKAVPHWKKLPEHFPVPAEELIKLPAGQPKKLPKLQVNFKDESSTERLERTQKLSTIKESFRHAWIGYKQKAMGHDEIRPVTGGYRDPFAGWGATLVDALDTLWIMDMKDEFSAAVDEIKKIDFTTTFRKDIPLFETVIRYLGGFIGAYDISGHKYPVLLDKAVELAEILIGAFDTPNRMPVTFYYWAPDYVSQPHRGGTRVVLAELGSLSVEFTRLAQLKKENKYYDAIARITNELEKMQSNTKLPGMWPLLIDASGCKKNSRPISQIPLGTETEKEAVPDVLRSHVPQHAPTDINSYKNYVKRDDEGGLHVDAQPVNYGKDAPPAPASTPLAGPTCEKQGLGSPPSSTSDKFGLGGQSDSTYEYLPKEYMLLGGLNGQYRTLYETAMDTVRKYLLFRPMIKEDRDILFAATVTVPNPQSEKEDEKTLDYSYEGTHLACFAGGMFAVGAKLFGLDGDMDIAAKLTDSCVWAYESTTTGIMPESFEVLPCEDVHSCEWNETRYRHALDPYETSRIQQAEAWYQRQVQLLEENQEGEDTSKSAPSPVSVRFPAVDSETTNSLHSKRNELAAEAEQLRAQDDQTPTKTVPGADDRDSISTLHHTAVVPPPKHLALSHEDYVNARIKEERLPPGLTKIGSRKYILRPEAIESVFIMFRLTGDNYWRQKGWNMFTAITASTRTELGDSAILDVTSEAPFQTDQMESFWLAETLKYFYLLFSDPSLVSLDEYVLNTEAHPHKRPLS